MKISFDVDVRREITEANINYYNKPFIHPKRKMNEHDFIYLLQGEWKIGQNSKSYDLKKDTLLILSANQTHYGVSLSKPNTKTMYFHVTSAADDEFNCSVPNSKNISLNSLNYVGNNNIIKKIFYDIVTAKLSGNEKKSAILFDLLLNELSSMNQDSNTSNTVEKIVNLIQRNPEKFLSNSELAKMANVSVKTAETKFKKIHNTTIHQYILNYKIEQATSYFKTFPEMSLKNVAYNLGFYDEYHFSKQFKKITGYSPSYYKDNLI